MARVRVKTSVGLQRLSAGRDATLKAFTRDARKSMKEVAKNLENVISKIEDATPEAVEYGMKPIWDLSRKYVPVDTGRLQASGQFVVQERGGKIEAAISYGKGGEPEYAIYVHERLDQAHAAPTRAKFLQAAVNEKLHLVLPRVRQYLQNKVGIK